MEFRQLQYAIQIAKKRTFPGPQKSFILRNLLLASSYPSWRRKLECFCFERTTNSVELTHAGSVFVEKAQSILDNIEQLNRRWKTSPICAKASLWSAALPITGSHVLPLVLPVFGKLYPEINRPRRG